MGHGLLGNEAGWGRRDRLTDGLGDELEAAADEILR